MKIETALDLYDLYVTEQISKKLKLVDTAKFINCPTDLVFRFAKEKLKTDEIFPLYSIFRNDPFIESDISSVATYRKDYILDNTKSINYINGTISYQIDFYSNSMIDMNKANIDYYNFRKDAWLEFDFTNLGIDCKFTPEVQFTPIEANNNITDMFQTGRYFRYTFGINLYVMVFNINKEVQFDKFIFSIYEKNYSNLVYKFEKDII